MITIFVLVTGEAARKRVYKEFKLETMVHRTCRLYAQLLESPGLMNLEGFNRKYVLLPNTLDETSF